MISSNVNSIQANNIFANNSAHNIANVNSDGFVPNQTRISGNSLEASTQKADDNGSLKSQTNLATELTNQIQVENINEANINAIRTQDEMLGTLLDLKA